MCSVFLASLLHASALLHSYLLLLVLFNMFCCPCFLLHTSTRLLSYLLLLLPCNMFWFLCFLVSCFYLAPLMLTSSSSVQHVLFSLLLVSCFFLCLVMSPSTVTWWSSYWIYLLQDLFVFIRRSWGVDSAFSTNCSQGLLWLRDFS